MEWLVLAAAGVLLAAVVGLKLLGSVPRGAARAFLRHGARVIDVRSREEFRARHLPSAINIPLGELTERIGQVVPNKDEVLLLHCLGGGRSGLGARWLKGMGYRRAYNLGSYRRAERVVGEASSTSNPRSAGGEKSP